jgi:hypothetical protein
VASVGGFSGPGSAAAAHWRCVVGLAAAGHKDLHKFIYCTFISLLFMFLPLPELYLSILSCCKCVLPVLFGTLSKPASFCGSSAVGAFGTCGWWYGGDHGRWSNTCQ